MITILDYGAGNIASVRRSLERLGYSSEASSDPKQIEQAKALVFPGVGAAGAAMNRLRALGLDRALSRFVASGRPLLGICLGMQLLFDFSEEDGGVECLGILPGRVVRLSQKEGLKIPHMGWNQVEVVSSGEPGQGLASEQGTRVFQNRPTAVGDLKKDLNRQWFYFVHSYVPVPSDCSIILGRTHHGSDFASVVQRDNILAVQFHPEKSGTAGEKLLATYFRTDWFTS